MTLLSPVSRTTRLILLFVLGLSTRLNAAPPALPHDLSLNGTWQIGIDRNYTATAEVPGLAQDPAKPSPGTLWYRRSVLLPAGDWKQATLTLHGARFHPEVYVDGQLAGSSEGGMAPISFPLKSSAVSSNHRITIEIALRSLSQMDPADASTVPTADLWRTDVSSGLWDDVDLHLSGDAQITRSVPWTDWQARRLSVHWQASGVSDKAILRAELVSAAHLVVASHTQSARSASGSLVMPLPAAMKPWSPEHPQLYQLRLTLTDHGRVQDVIKASWGLKRFETRDKRFYLNGQPVEMLGGTVVWHRFLRQPHAADVAWSVPWFQQNITARLRSYGANTLRWHLGLPPERLLDLCDREGLMVQLEWPFFHGISASIPSMTAQWTAWLNVAMRHPSVMIVHAWNETGDPKAIGNGWQALNAALENYPPFVVAHRDTVHIHKYWWSLFENLGLYYDDARDFDRTAMVDEFGGNYLDWNADPGGYPATKESFLRFLGRDQTRGERLQFHAESNARVAEYWRRIGAAGILPFCILGGPQDGSSWFLGDLHRPQPMPVWDQLAAAWSPVSVSLDVWDRNYVPGQTAVVPLHLFNDTGETRTLRTDVNLLVPNALPLSTQRIARTLEAHTHVQVLVSFHLPQTVGALRLEAVLVNPPAGITHRVVSAWDIRTLKPVASATLAGVHVALAADEPELAAMLHRHGILTVPLEDPAARVILGSAATWSKLKFERALRDRLGASVQRGVSVVLLDVGPRDLGEGYRKQSLGTLDGAPTVRDPYTESADLFAGVKVTFQQQAEPESHIQPGSTSRALWENLPIQATWIWNGLRGGLIAPAADMQVSGLSQSALQAQWKDRGADAASLGTGAALYAYELQGYYAFSNRASDQPTQDALRRKVRLLVEDAPALKDVVDPNAAIDQIDLAEQYRNAAAAQARQMLTLSTCGKNLTRADIVELTLGQGRGNLILSQALTAGRLGTPSGKAAYDLRYDPAAEQMTLNMIAQAIRPIP